VEKSSVREVFNRDKNFENLIALTQILQLANIAVNSYSTKYRVIGLNEVNMTNYTKEVGTNPRQ
jgi:hypothetical protein